jgi:hypothetical protein
MCLSVSLLVCLYVFEEKTIYIVVQQLKQVQLFTLLQNN